ncbi:uncharacterized protein [Diadema antillarum]|uniref:uncharacterized protein n=1 Tax=Diadema antillarum TaxID=105358 RepID=UPI003A872AB8
MATPSGGKIRSKRSHSSRKPYERPKPKSLLARVSDTVKDFITPSWLNNLWTNPNDDDGEGSSRSSTPEPPASSNVVASTPGFMPPAVATSTPDVNTGRGKEALAVPSQTEVETTPIVQSQGDVVQERDDDVMIIEEDIPSTSRGIRHTPLPFRNYANPIGTSTPNEEIQALAARKPILDKDDASDTSVSTSGCSSLIPHVDKIDHREKLSKKNLDRLSEMAHSNSMNKSSLWSSMSGAGPSGAGSLGLSSSRPQQAITSAKKPSFNSSYFGSPRLLGEDRPRNASPFYPGRTQFGGSSAQRSSLKRVRNSPYEVHLPIKRNIKPKPANINLDSKLGATSSTAKKILDTLERMSTPLLDAKKIPLSPTASPYSFRPTSRLSRRPGTSKARDPPVSGLHVAHQASIAPNRQPPVSMVIDVEKEDRTKDASAEIEVLPVSTAATTASVAPSFRFSAPISSSTPTTSASQSVVTKDKAGGKMKSKVKNTQHYSSHQEDDDVVEVPDLPQVALPLSGNLPKFNFGTALSSAGAPALTSTLASSSAASSVASSGSIFSSKSSTSTAAPASTSTTSSASFKFSAPSAGASAPREAVPPESFQFKFAAPIIKHTPSVTASSSMTSSSTATTFKFSMPRQTPYPTSRPAANAPLEAKKPSFETPERTRRKEAEQVQKKGDDGGAVGGIKVAKELKTGSCLEAFGIMPTKNGPIPSSSSMVQVKVLNSAVDNGPLSSGSIEKSGTSILKKAPSELSNSVLDAHKPPADSWECDTCMLINKPDIDNCPACVTPRPGAKPSNKTSFTFGQSNTEQKTVASASSKSAPLFNSLGDKLREQSQKLEGGVCMVDSGSTSSLSATKSAPKVNALLEKSEAGNAVSAAKPITNSLADRFKAAPGEWECDTCMIRNKATILKCMACDSPKPGSQPVLSAPPTSSVKFGSTSLSNGETSGAFKFGSTTTSSSLNANLNNAGSKDTAQSGAFKLPAGLSLGSSSKPASLNGIGNASSEGGFKLPTNFSFSKPTDSSSSLAKKSDQEGSSGGTVTSTPNHSKLDKSSTTGDSVVSGGFKFGASTESKTAGQNFQFGAGAGAETKTADGGFKFSASTESKPAGDGFKFGAGTATGGFKFGQSDSAKSEKTNSIAAGGGFKFGQSAATVGQTTLEKEGPPPNVNIFQSKTEEDGPPSKTFAFGAPAEKKEEKKADTAAPSFSFGGAPSSTKPSSAPFQFGAGAGTTTTTLNASKPQNASAGTGKSQPFTFGGTATSVGPSSTASFSFGGASKADQAAPASTGGMPPFTFGEQKSTTAPQAAAPGFSFTAKSQEPTSTPGTALFAQTSQPAATAAAASGTSAITFGTGVSTTKAGDTGKAATFTFGSQNHNNNQGSSGFSFGAATTSSATGTSQPAPSFNFGNAAMPSATTPSGGFSFGSAQNSASTGAAMGGFTAISSNPSSSQSSGFGGFGSTAAAPAPSFGGFSSASNSSNPSPAFGAQPSAAPAASTFSFGGATTTSATGNPFGGSQAAASPFAQAASTPSASLFGAANPSSGFGNTSGVAKQAPAFGSGTNAMSNSTSGFGSSTTSSGSGGFQFSKQQPTSFQFGTSTNSAPAGAAGAFQFTGNQPNQTPQATPAVAPQPAGGFSFSAGQPTSFNFGGNTPQAGATPYTFQASGATNTNPFSATGTPGAPSGRKIKRAVRRTTRR